jgi:hypothetical protein
VKGLPWLLALVSLSAQADLPLAVEDILTAHHRYRVETNLEYSNREYSDLSSGFVSSSDLALLSVGLRWGWTLRTELFARVYGYQSQVRLQQGQNQTERNDTDWSRVLVGVNHQFSDDDQTPALLGFATVDLLDNPGVEGADVGVARNINLGLTSYRSLDPLLLSAVAMYEYHTEYDVGEVTLEPGNSFSLSPQFAFAVNHLVTLTGGVTWEWHDSPRVDRESLTITRSRTRLLLGMGYSWSEDISLSLNGAFSVTDSEGSSLNASVVYKFDDRKRSAN